MTIQARDIQFLPANVRSAASVRAFVRLEELAALNPQHELFVIWNYQVPGSPFAVVMRMPKRRVEEAGWPFFVDRESRVMEMRSFAPG